MFNIKDDVLKGLVYIYMILYKYSICHKYLLQGSFYIGNIYYETYDKLNIYIKSYIYKLNL